MKLVDHFTHGLDAPICLTWELTYACNLSCVHCLSRSGRRDPNELSTDEAKAVIDELQRMQVFYVNIGGGEPTVRSDFWELLDYAIAHDVGVKFSTNGVKLDKERAAQLAATDYVDVQISLDGATAEVNDHVRGPGSYDTAIRAMENLAEAGFGQFKISVVVTRQNVDQLDEFKAIADRYGAQLRITRLRPSRPRRRRLGRAAPAPGPAEASSTTGWSRAARASSPATRSSTSRPTAQELPGLNLCGAGRVVCLIDPVGDVYACPFAIHEQFLAGNVRSEGGFRTVWQDSRAVPRAARARSPVARARSASHYDACQGGCMAAKFFTGLPARRPGPGVRARQRRAGARGARRRAGAPEVRRGPFPVRPPQLPRRPGTDLDRDETARQGLRDQPTGRGGRRRERLAPARLTLHSALFPCYRRS